MSQNKLDRQNRIKHLLLTMFIPSQEECAKHLLNEGIVVTQATLSRDFAELGVARVMTDKGMRYVIDQNESGKIISQLIGFEVLHIDSNENLIVIRTLSGRAQGVAQYIDRLEKKEILGTVAGDDTVLVIPDSINNVKKLVDILQQIMHEGLPQY